MTEENKGTPEKETPPEPTLEQKLETLTKEAERLAAELQKKEQSYSSLEGISRKQSRELEEARAKLDAAISSRDTIMAVLGWASQQTGKSEEEISQEVETRKPDLMKQTQQLIMQQDAKRKYEAFQQKFNSYAPVVEELGLKPSDRRWQRINAFCTVGNWEAADEEIEAIKAEQAKTPAKSEEKKQETEEEMKERLEREILEKYELTKQETGSPSASSGAFTITRAQLKAMPIAERRELFKTKDVIVKD